jgi:hypothetical protein
MEVQLVAVREAFLEDDDELNLFQTLGVLNGFIENEVFLECVQSGSFLRRVSNIDKDRVEMHERMFENYFVDSAI